MWQMLEGRPQQKSDVDVKGGLDLVGLFDKAKEE